ncbi:hypothetical protein KP803_12485 [Vibrio sp. ZSDE26]|uniref:Serine/threonine protein kinase n=1 Tax=Vibrio amylolyticus TaxID=2847292 RepID=A0A9X1XJK0_9VIBR|nr:hypothetical protein [Vibrio amylolyticus]MCK6264089.1 hypothetical protein [Vibrio amylolyticus]
MAKRNQEYVHLVERDGTRYWLKKRGEEKRNPMSLMINGVLTLYKPWAHLTLHSGLTPAQRFAKELSILGDCQRLNLPIPRLYTAGRAYFVTLCAGKPITEQQGAKNKTLFHSAFDSLHALHKEKIIHGRPAMRDMVVNDQGNVVLLDFEEARRSESALLRTRDMFLFMLDSFRLSGVSQKTRLSVLKRWCTTYPLSVVHIKRLNWFIIKLLWIPKLILHVRKNRLSKQLLLTQRLLSHIK